MYRLLLAVLLVGALGSFGANLIEYGGATLHPRHGERLADAAGRDGLLVQVYTTAGRAILPPLQMEASALGTAQEIYSAAFAVLDRQPSATDERTFSDMLHVPGVYRPLWRRASTYATPVLLVLLLVAWIFRPRVIHSFPNQR
jgi:hypothetical protein